MALRERKAIRNMQFKINLSPPNLLNICVDCTDDGEIRGRVYHCYKKEAVSFANVVELIKIAEYLFEDIGYPQASTKSRSFGEKQEAYHSPCVEKVVEQKELLQHRGKKGTFITHVQYRQRSTWQGELSWIEKEESYRFHNSLEFIKLIDQVEEHEKHA